MMRRAAFRGPVHRGFAPAPPLADFQMTTESRRLIASLAEAKCRPTFEVRQLKSAPGWYVRVLWQYGLEQRVNGFASADEAQTWINKKSEGWLRNRTAALRGASHGPARDALASLDRF
jgi:hypothetical protein